MSILECCSETFHFAKFWMSQDYPLVNDPAATGLPLSAVPGGTRFLFILALLRTYVLGYCLPPLRGWFLFLLLIHGLRRGAAFCRRFAAGVWWDPALFDLSSSLPPCAGCRDPHFSQRTREMGHPDLG